jgi:hypothetical protein
MNKLFLLLLLITSMIGFTNCKNKSNDPSPTSSGFLTVSGTTETLSVTYNNSKPYQITGTAATGIYTSLAASFPNGQPNAGFTVTFPSTNLNLFIYNSSNGSQYNATSGSATIQVSSSFTTTINFTNVTFTSSQNSSQTFTASGQMVNVN